LKNHVSQYDDGTIEESAQIPSVNIDYEQAAMDVVESFHQHGHDRIAIVTGPFKHAITEREILPGMRKYNSRFAHFFFIH